MRHAVILAGGRGVRLWPMSRRARPKHVVQLFNGKSLLALAVQRATALVGADRVWVCSNADVRPHAIEECGVAPERFIEEPCGRDTLAAVALSSAVVGAQDPDATLVVLTADHLITPMDAFVSAMQIGCAVAESDEQAIVTFTIKPAGPDRGYGYIERGAVRSGFEGRAFDVVRYVEKPEADEAQAFVESGRHGWSAGMFAFRASLLLDLMEQVQSGSGDVLSEIGRQWGTPAGQRIVEEWYDAVKQTSVDYGIMVPGSRGELSGVSLATVELTGIEWIDVGTWDRLASILDQDRSGNVRVGDSVLQDCRGVVAVSADAGHTVAAIGCHDLVVVHTDDVTFVCPRNRLGELKGFVDGVGEAWT